MRPVRLPSTAPPDASPEEAHISADIRLGIALVLLLAAATGVLAAAGVRIRQQVVVAALRATLQLAVIGVVLGLRVPLPGRAAVVLAGHARHRDQDRGPAVARPRRRDRAVLLPRSPARSARWSIAFGTGAVAFRSGTSSR